MAEPDDIDKLLAEIDAMNKGTTQPAVMPSQTPAVAPGSASGRGQWTAVAAGGAGALGLVTGSVLAFLPYISGLPTALGAALGGAAVALVSGPPAWFRRGR